MKIWFIAVVAVYFINLMICDDSICADKTCEDTNALFTLNRDSKVISLVEVDIYEYINGDILKQKEIANLVNEQLHKVGSFRIKNHGLSLDLMNEIYSNTKQFFEQTDEFKSKYDTKGILGVNGWESIGSKNVGSVYNSSSKKDPVESLQFWNVQLFNDKPDEMNKYVPHDLGKCVIAYAKQSRLVANILQNMFTLSLNLSINQFEIDMTEVNNTNVKNNYFNQFALWNYPDLNSLDNENLSDIYSNDEFSREYRFGTHSDWSSITMVRLDDIEGFQFKLERIDNEWYTVTNDNISEDSLLINLGEVMQMYTGGYWLAPRHRVATLSNKRRISIAYFVGPNMNRIINEIDECIKCKQNKNDTIMQQYTLPMLFKDHARARFSVGFEINDLLPFWLK